MRLFLVAVILMLLPMALSWACDLRAQDYTGEITLQDSSMIEFDWFWIVPGKDRVRYSEDMMDLRMHAESLSYVRLSSVSKIDFLDFTGPEKRLMDSLRFCPAMRKAKMQFTDGAIVEKVYLDCTGAFWVGDTESGKLNDRKIQSIKFDVKELKKCPHCNKQYRHTDWKYCPYCGKPLD
jgi:hypothetical protein